MSTMCHRLQLKCQRRADFLRAAVPRYRATLFAAVSQGRYVPSEARRGSPPSRLSLHEHGPSYCSKFDVFFKTKGGKEFIRQTACTVADSDRGFITRYTHARGHTGTSSEVETLRGTVVIKWKRHDSE